MRNYLDLLRHAYEKGSRQINERTGEVTLKVVGPQLRYDLQAGFPLVTSSKKHLRSIIEELLWFIRGDTNNELLRARGVSIWDEWALTEPHVRKRPYSNRERAGLYAEREGLNIQGVLAMLDKLDSEEVMRGKRPSSKNGGEPNGGEKFLDDQNVPAYEDLVIHPVGELGPIYGRMWRYWPNPDGTTTDQLVQVLNDLKERPFSRRHIVTAWNPSVLPEETVNAQENVRRGRQALAPCHAFYQFVVEQLDRDQRIALYTHQVYNGAPTALQLDADPIYKLQRENVAEPSAELQGLIDATLAAHQIPDKRLGTVVTQRSADIPLGVPYNIASYAILTMMIAKQLNFALGELVMNFGDAHIYHKQMEGVALQITREPRPLPKLLLNPDVKNFFDYKFEDFQLVGYDPHPTIKYEITV